MNTLSTTEVVTELNRLFAEEVEAALRYLHLSNAVRGLERRLIEPVLKEGLAETLQHAEVIAQKIRSLGHVPRLDIGVSLPAAALTAREALRQALTVEEASLEAYQDVLRRVEGDVPLEEFIRSQIAVESAHVAELKELLEQDRVSNRARIVVLLVALCAYCLCAELHWHESQPLRRAAGIVIGVLILWISEVAPLGITALAIPVAAVFSGVMTWDAAIAKWGDKVLFLFLGAFLLARALDKHGAFDWIHAAPFGKREDARRSRTVEPAALGVGHLSLIVLLLSGAVSLFQNNTAVTAMLLPAVTLLSGRTRAAAFPLLALSYGATLGGMGTPVGTAPNFIGYSEMRKLDESYSFVKWLQVGIPIWIGTTALAWALLTLAARLSRGENKPPGLFDGDSEPGALLSAEPGKAGALPSPVLTDPAERTAARRWAIAAFALTALIWLVTGFIRSAIVPDSEPDRWMKRYLPEELIPIAAAWLLFIVRIGPRRRPVLDRHDFQSLDWDTLFLIAGGLTLGELLRVSGASTALAQGVAGLDLPPTAILFALAGATVLLSELTSNTATASLLVPIAASLAPAAGLTPVHAIMLVALCASLGFALPISTPPNALVYGTRLIPLRTMATVGLVLDAACVTWVVLCVRWFA